MGVRREGKLVKSSTNGSLLVLKFYNWFCTREGDYRTSVSSIIAICVLGFR